jgi:hypothetical protein
MAWAILHSAFVSSTIVVEFISKEMACFVFDARSESSKHRPMTYKENFQTATSLSAHSPSSFFKNNYFAPLCALNHKLIKRTDITSKKMIFSAERCSLILGLLLIVLTTRYIYTRLLSRCSLPEILPWVGVKDDGYLSRARATFLSFLHTRDLVQEGYSKVCTFPTSKLRGAPG